MIPKELVRTWTEKYLQDTDYQVCELQISADNHILVEIDRKEGVDVDFCGELNHFLTSQLDQDPKTQAEDYSLEVGSVCLTDPFKTRLQYEKNLGHDVEVLDREGKKHRGQLVSVDEESFQIDTEVMVQVEGKKRKQKQVQTLTFAYADVKYTKYELKV